MNRPAPDDSGFPAPPWELRGHGVMILAPASRRARDLSLPDGCSLQSLVAGRSFRGYYLAEYSTPLSRDAALPWHEWGNVAGYVRSAGGNGFFISGMAVDSGAACQGGREIWGLNKFRGDIRMAAAGRAGEASLAVEDGLVEARWKPFGPGLRLSPTFRFVTAVQGKVRFYTVTIHGRFRLARAWITRRTSPSFPALKERLYGALRFEEGTITITAPQAPMDHKGPSSFRDE